MAQGVGEGGSVLAAVANEGGGDSVYELVGKGLGLWGPLTTELVGVVYAGLVVTRLTDPWPTEPHPIAAMSTEVATGTRNRTFTMLLKTDAPAIGFYPTPDRV